jgi:hypothetical protein
MLPPTFVPLSQTLTFWPSHLFGEPEFLNEIGVRDFKITESYENLLVSGTVLWFREIGFDILGLKGFSIVLLNENGHTAVPFEINLARSFALTLPNLTFAIRLDSEFLRPVKLVDGKWVEVLDAKGAPKPAEVRLDGVGLTVIHTGDFKLLMPQGAPQLSLGAVQIGDSGVVVEIDGVKPYFSRKQKPPSGIPSGFRGLAITSVKLHLPTDINVPLAPSDLTFSNMLIGTGGFSGKITGGWSPTFDVAAKEFTGNGAGHLFGIPFGLRSLSVEFKQNTPTDIDLKGDFLLPFFDDPVRVSIAIGLSGNLMVSLDSVDGNGLITLTKPNVLEIELDSIGFQLKNGVFMAKLSGQLTPLFGAAQGLKWPGFKVEELSIDSKGHVHLQGGWLNLREQQNLDFYGFHIGITKLGFGKTDDGGKWVGFSGELKLVDGFTAGASVDGLRVTWYEGHPNKTKITLEGVGVEFASPDVLRFKGHVAYQEIDVAGGGSVHRFVGDIKLKLIALKLDIDAKLIVGSASGGPQGNYNFFAIYLNAELPTGIPLGSTPLALYGMAGLFALQMEPDKKTSEEWYEGWYKRPSIGVSDLEKKWINRRGTLALGGGVTIGTNSDEGFTFAAKALLVIVFPGPIILLEGKANLLAERAKLDDDPLFRSLAVLDMRQGQILIGLDAQYKREWQTGKIINIRAGAEAFFHTPNDWHVYMGEKEPRAKRIRARMLSLFDADAYFMIDPKQLRTGAWVGFAQQWKFGPVNLALEAFLEGNVVVNFTPLHFHGDLWLHGNIEVKVFGFGLGLSVDARFAADVFDPFHVKASFEASVRLPKPLKKKNFHITLEWGPIADWPKQLPLPLKEVAVEHFKVTTSWPLPKDSTPPLLLPKYDPDVKGMRGSDGLVSFNQLNPPPLSAMPVVPLDCRPHLSFGRSVHDDALIGVNPQAVQPEYERIGDTDKNEGPVRVRYGLREIELAKWDAQQNLWRPVASKPAVSGVRALYGSWAAVPQLPSGTGQAPVANNKLWLWSKTPFDYTRHGGSDWDDWFIDNFPSYPCVPQDVPDREVCFDFETVDSAQWLQSPWHLPVDPEIILGWQAPPRQHVTTLDSPVEGFTHALSFPALVSACLPPPPADLNPSPVTVGGQSGETVLNTVTIKLSIPAKQVKVWFVKNKSDQVCLDFRNRPRDEVNLPLIEQGLTIGSSGITRIEPIATTLGDMMGLICTADPMDITLPFAATTVELMLTHQAHQPASFKRPPNVEAYDSAGAKVGEKPILNLMSQPEIVRFEGSDLKRIRINSFGVAVFLHKLCFFCPATFPDVTATAFDADGKQIGIFVNQDNVVEITAENLSRVQLNSNNEIRLLKICALFGADPIEVEHRQEMENHLKSEVARWSQEGEVLEPFSAYQLKIVTTIHAYGEGALSGSSNRNRNLTQTEYAYFRTEGPPGLTKLSLPPGRDAKDADKFDSGLEDLTRYVRQTMPATVPAPGQKPVMAKPFYRAYDIGVEFNENYVDLMYRIGGRDLGLYLYDNNNRPMRDAEGRLLIQSGDWGAVEELTLTEGAQHWVALSNTANRCLPVIDQESIVHDKKLTSAIAERVLEPDTVYEGRLIPLLLREDFRNYAVNASAQGPAGKLGRWEVHDEGDSNTPSKWEVSQTGTPPAHLLRQTSSIKGGADDAADPVKPGTVLIFGNDPALDAGHSEQPANWTDYRLSVYLHAHGDGAMGLVFRCGDLSNYYRFSLDRNRKYRRLVSIVNGIHSILKEDDFIYEPHLDYLITVEAIGDTLRVYQDGALIFEVTDLAHAQGSIGLYCYDNAGTRFNDVRVDDFRKTAPVVYRFEFTTSLFANFFHHLHSFQDETWRVAIEGEVGAGPALLKAVHPSAPVTDVETRAYETLATTVLGQAARQNPPEVQVSRVEIDGAPLAFLVQSPEPIDWLRTEIALSRTSLARTEPALPGKVKLAAVNFAANRIDIDSVVVLLPEPLSLTGYRIESRLVTWPVNLKSGVVIDAKTLSADGLPQQVWTTYSELQTEKNLAAGTILLTSTAPTASGQLTGLDAGSVDFSRRIFYSVELRLVAPDGKIVHARHFLPDDDYVQEDVSVLRKADGTGLFMIKHDGGLNPIPFSLAQYRLKLTYHRNNRTRLPASQVWSQAGDHSDEIVTLDIPIQTQ